MSTRPASPIAARSRCQTSGSSWPNMIVTTPPVSTYRTARLGERSGDASVVVIGSSVVINAARAPSHFDDSLVGLFL